MYRLLLENSIPMIKLLRLYLIKINSSCSIFIQNNKLGILEHFRKDSIGKKECKQGVQNLGLNYN